MYKNLLIFKYTIRKFLYYECLCTIGVIIQFNVVVKYELFSFRSRKSLFFFNILLSTRSRQFTLNTQNVERMILYNT